MGGAGSEGCSVRLPRCRKTGKVGFPSKDQAEARAVFVVGFMQREKALRVYRCPDCHQWHMTKRVKPGQGVAA